MKSWQIVRMMAGLFISLSLALGISGSPLFVSAWWLAFTAFVGVNLLQSALRGLRLDRQLEGERHPDDGRPDVDDGRQRNWTFVRVHTRDAHSHAILEVGRHQPNAVHHRRAKVELV